MSIAYSKMSGVGLDINGMVIALTAQIINFIYVVLLRVTTIIQSKFKINY